MELSQESICSLIFQGWDFFASFIRETQNEETERFFGPEYLITVKIADSLNHGICASSFSIILENQTLSAFTRRISVPFIKKQKFIIPVKRLMSNSERNGKFDISIFKNELFYSADPYQTYCVIEVKNFENDFKRHKADIKRINELLNDNSNSKTEFGVLTFSQLTRKRDWFDLESNNEFIINKYKQKYIKKLELEDPRSITKCKKGGA